MSAGLFGLLDDIAALARLAAASVDDIGAAAGRATAKAAGVVIDDTAVTPQYVHGITADRELPMIKRIAIGSLRNKLVFILPAALLLSQFVPSLLTPILMIGATYLCYEGGEKVWRDFMASAPDEIGGTLVEFSTIPADPEYPKDAWGAKVMTLAGVWAGPADEGEAAVQPLRVLADPLLDFRARCPTARCSSCTTGCSSRGNTAPTSSRFISKAWTTQMRGRDRAARGRPPIRPDALLGLVHGRRDQPRGR